jgi:hypothetical protein
MSQNKPKPLSDLHPEDDALGSGVRARGRTRRKPPAVGFTRDARLKVEKLAPWGIRWNL